MLPLNTADEAKRQSNREPLHSHSGQKSRSEIGVQLPISPFLEYLVANSVIDEEAAIQVSLMKQERKELERRSVVDILSEEFNVSRDMLCLAVAKFYSFRVIDVNKPTLRRLPLSLVNKLMVNLQPSVYASAMKHKVLPFETADGQPDKLIVVTPNPADREVYHVGRSFPYKRYEICYMREQDWSELWRKVTLQKQTSLHELEPLDVVEHEESDIEDLLEGEINRGHLVNMVGNIFSDAVRLGASDIHIVPQGPRRTDILFRVDGQLSLWYSIEDARAEAVVAVVKGSGLSLDRFERMSAQDGAGQKMIDNRLIRFRFSVLPVISNEMGGKFESVVIRILKDADASMTIEEIGFDAYSQRVFHEALAKPFGLVILTGPTGCGKSTTLSAALRSVMRPEVNTITVEDPVEYILPGARQVKLNNKLSFENAMRAILRHDPDIVMVGEIRDRITADIAIQLSNTGHLSFSTLHTNDAPSAITRLFKMGVEPFLLAQALNIVVAQRLIRKLCEQCKEPVHGLSETLRSRAGLTPHEASQIRFFKPVGCPNCIGGFKGRTAIHESLYVTQEIRGIIMDSGERIDKEAIRQASIRNGMQTLRQSGMSLVKKGITTLDEVISNTTND